MGVSCYWRIVKTKEYEFKVITPGNIVDIVALHYESLNAFLNAQNLMYW